MFWYTTFTADMVKEGLPVLNADGSPKWRMAPSPHGAYWEEGQKLGYQDAGSWTLMSNTPEDRAKAAWLYAQFVTSKTVDVKQEPCRPHLHSREHDPAPELHGTRAQAGRP